MPGSFQFSVHRSGSSRGAIAQRTGVSFVMAAFLCALVLVSNLILCGCATEKPADAGPAPGSGIAEYAQLAKDASKNVRASLVALDRFAGSAGHNSESDLAAFSRAVQDLQVKSQTVRAHAQAMEARGDAYFANWETNLARVKDVQVRELAERHHEELQQSFQRIKSDTQQGRGVFKAYLAGLRGLRVTVEKDPASLGSESTTELIKKAREQGEQVEKQLDAILAELRGMAAMLKLSKSQTGL
jgi:hypothetical protein